MKITIIGTGYVGLVSGTCFADIGHEVLCIDNDQDKVEKLKNGIIPIFEPGLSEKVLDNVKAGRLGFSTELRDGVDYADVIFLCLPTPPKEDGSADLSYVLGVASDITEYADSYKLLINKSTVPVGTGDLVKEIFEKAGKDFLEVASNPEFLREGAAVDDFLNPDRVVFGVDSNKSRDLMLEIYKPFSDKGVVLVDTAIRSSELIKYTSNAFLATKISFINEIANLCEKVGANVQEVARGAGLDSRIGSKFLQAGIGYGGSCFPKDVSALHKTGQQYQVKLQILDTVMRVNEYQREHFVEKIIEKLNGDFEGSKIAIWGLSFKANTDDIRKTPAVEIIQALQDRGARIVAYDPEAMENFQKYTDIKIDYASNKYEALEGAKALVIVTEWEEFRTADMDKVKELLASPTVFDGRNLYNLVEMEAKGFRYFSIGR